MRRSCSFRDAFLLSVGAAMLLAFNTITIAKPDESLTIHLPSPDRYPRVATTPERLARLRQGYQSSDHWRKKLDGRFIKPARRLLDQPIDFPPRGGQHPQWYNCPRCEVELKTISPTQHQCPQCGEIYSGEPYDGVVYRRQHRKNLANAWRAAWAYAITREEAFARYAGRILVGYGRRYRDYPLHSNRGTKPLAEQSAWHQRSAARLFAQTLDEASQMMRHIAPAYDLIRNARTLSDQEDRIIREGLIRPIVKNIADHPTGQSNWQSFHNGAMLWGGAMLNEKKWVARAIHDPENGFLHQMQASVTEDGMWYEGSWSYHFYALSALAGLARGADNLGINLWDQPALVKMYLLPMRYAMPDGSLPRFGDATSPDVRDGVSDQVIEPIYSALQDERLIPMMPDEATWISLLYGNLNVPARGQFRMPAGSDRMPDAGHLILRTAGEPGLAAAATYGYEPGFHAHQDKLSFVLYGYKQELGVDPGRARAQAYRLPVHRQWYKHTLSHNTVLVDQKAQNAGHSELLSLTSGDRYAAALLRSEELYEGVTQTRMLVMTPTYLLVFDDLESDQPHRYDWLYHNTGSSVSTEIARREVDFEDRDNGLAYLRDAQQGQAESAVEGRFEGEKLTTHVFTAGTAPSTVTTATGRAGSMEDRAPMLMLTRSSTPRMRFAAVIEPRPRGDPSRIDSVELKEEKKNRVVVVIHRGGPGENHTREEPAASPSRPGSVVDTVHLNMNNHRITVEHEGKLVLSSDSSAG